MVSLTIYKLVKTTKYNWSFWPFINWSKQPNIIGHFDQLIFWLFQPIIFLVKTTILNWLSQMHPNDQFFLVILTNLFLQCKRHSNDTELSKYIWKLKDNKQEFDITWSVISYFLLLYTRYDFIRDLLYSIHTHGKMTSIC